MRIGLDVDGVIYQFQKTALYMLNSMKGYDLKLEDWNAWDWPKQHVKNNDWQWLWTAGVRMGLFRYGHLYKGSIEGIRALADIGDVIIITHRPASAVGDTLDWLAYLRLPFKEVHLLTEGQAKSQIKCDLYVDDKPENIDDYSGNTRGLPLLWLRPWNEQHIEGFADNKLNYGTRDAMCQYVKHPVVQTWKEVVEIAERVSGKG